MKSSPLVKTILRTGMKVLAALILALVANWLIAIGILTHHYGRIKTDLEHGEWPLDAPGRTFVFQSGNDASQASRIDIKRNDEETALTLDLPGQQFSPLRISAAKDQFLLHSLTGERGFAAHDVPSEEIIQAVQEFGSRLPRLGFREWAACAFLLRPVITNVQRTSEGFVVRVNTSLGSVWLGPESLPVAGDLGRESWQVKISPAKPDEPDLSTAATSFLEVPGSEMAASFSEAARILTTYLFPDPPPPDEIRQAGQGWMEVRDGHRQMYLEGSPYEIGRQHGSLDPAGVKKLSNRLVYGVGLLYSLKEGQWFPDAARKLVERQRPFILPAYFEEMKGLADGSGLPLDLIQMANIFPEFFHCSGAALMGDATVDGELLHARVLDYMVGVGLQNHAAVTAITRPGVNRFVTVGYVGFIGSVTGMNEKKVAIGEMGGDGQGAWDGVPMSLLIRQALEECDTLEEAVSLMNSSPRTCEYYYVISDGKGPSAVGIAATPEVFETFGPGIQHPNQNQPVKDTVLLSRGDRYKTLVERVEGIYGQITPEKLIEIIKRPVAMSSNLHNVIFQPQSLRLSVADATHRGLACDQPYRTYTWNELFSAEPSR